MKRWNIDDWDREETEWAPGRPFISWVNNQTKHQIIVADPDFAAGNYGASPGQWAGVILSLDPFSGSQPTIIAQESSKEEVCDAVANYIAEQSEIDLTEAEAQVRALMSQQSA